DPGDNDPDDVSRLTGDHLVTYTFSHD
ncbi:MAG: hypothetical protein K0S86_4012, partial [Geminicoccaceae bacterium]|nr:hypothetical protein [Geminicoccaceae bacterium]